MKIRNLTINNLFGVDHVCVVTPEPVIMFAGPNGAGKSSIQNAVRLALTGSPSRVKLKKDYSQMINDGARKGSVAVTCGPTDTVVGMDLPKGFSDSIDDDTGALEYIMEPSAFARAKPDERRALLFKIAKVSANREAVQKRLQEAEIDQDKIDAIIPLLRSGFPAAHDRAKAKATEAKADWKAITREQWGAQKADGWKPESVPDIDHLELDNLGKKVSMISVRIEQLREERAISVAQEKAMSRAGELKEFAEDLDRARSALKAAEDRLEEQKGRVAYFESELNQQEVFECPCCSVTLRIGVEGLEQAERKAIDARAEEKLKEHQDALEMLVRARNNAEERFRKCENAVNFLKTLNNSESDLRSVSEIEEELEKTKAQESDAIEYEKKLLAQSTAYAENVNAAKNAQLENRNVLQWLKVAELMSPSGIPAELLSRSLQPLNDRLELSAKDTGWMRIEIACDMSIYADEREYHLLSESEQWRTDAVIAEALSHLSGLKLLCLDRFDVLEPKLRGSFINWLTILAGEQEIDTALVFGTLKQCPSSTDLMTCHWVESGKLKQQFKEAS